MHHKGCKCCDGKVVEREILTNFKSTVEETNFNVDLSIATLNKKTKPLDIWLSLLPIRQFALLLCRLKYYLFFLLWMYVILN